MREAAEQQIKRSFSFCYWKRLPLRQKKGFFDFFFGMLNQENLEVDLFSKADIQSLLRKSFTHCLLMFIVW